MFVSKRIETCNVRQHATSCLESCRCKVCVMQSVAKVSDTMLKLVAGGEHDLAHLSDAELLVNTRRLVGASNKLFAALLLHLAEIETRGIHRQRSCASLYTYASTSSACPRMALHGDRAPHDGSKPFRPSSPRSQRASST